jgi:hypothetical protein
MEENVKAASASKLFATYIVSVCIVVISMHNSLKPPPIDLHRQSEKVRISQWNVAVQCSAALRE